LTGYTLGGWYAGQQELLQSQYTRLSQGVLDVRLRPLETTALNTAMARGDFEVGFVGMVAPLTEVDAYPRNLFYSSGGRNYGKYTDPKFDEMLDKQRTMFDVAQRKAAIKEIIAYTIENGPYSSWAGRYILNASQHEVRDWAPEGELHAWGHQYQTVWLDT
jgi:ABC-type transport system substrate-binding protein